MYSVEVEGDGVILLVVQLQLVAYRFAELY